MRGARHEPQHSGPRPSPPADPPCETARPSPTAVYLEPPGRPHAAGARPADLHRDEPERLKPRLGAKKGSKQASATNVITANQTNAGSPGSAGLGGSARQGAAGTPHGLAGIGTPGNNGTVDTLSVGIGGGIAIIGTAVIDNTSITGNNATTADPNVDGTFST